MEQINENNSRDEIKSKLREHFDGKIVRKDLTKKIKEGANVPTYVLEYLLGQYCCSDDEEIIVNAKINMSDFAKLKMLFFGKAVYRKL